MPILIFIAVIFPFLYDPYLFNYYYTPKWWFLFLVSSALLIEMVIRRHKYEWRRLRSLPGKWWLLGFFVFLAASTLASPYRQIAFYGSPYIQMGFLTYFFIGVLFVFTFLVVTPEQLTRLLTVMFASATLVAVYGLAQHYGFRPEFYKQQMGMYFGSRSSSTIGSPNVFGTYLMLMFLIGCFLFATKQKWGYLFGTSIIYACMLTTLTRSVWIAGCCAFIILAWYSRKNRALIYLCLALALTSILIFSTSPAFGHRLNTVSTEIDAAAQQDPSFGSGRGLFWSVGWHDLTKGSLEEWLLGSGPDTFYKRVHFSSTQLHNQSLIVTKAFNIYLEMALTFGLPALLCLLLFYLRQFSWQDKDSPSLLLSLILLAYLIQGFFNVDVVSVYPLLMLVVAALAKVKVLETGKSGNLSTAGSFLAR